MQKTTLTAVTLFTLLTLPPAGFGLIHYATAPRLIRTLLTDGLYQEPCTTDGGLRPITVPGHPVMVVDGAQVRVGSV